MDIATAIKERRLHLGLSQKDLAEYAEIGISTVKDLERGVGNPSLQTLQKMMEVLGLEMFVKVRGNE